MVAHAQGILRQALHEQGEDDDEERLGDGHAEELRRQGPVLALPLLSPRGIFAAFQSDEPDPADPELSKALARTGARVLKCCPYRRPREERPRCLVVFAREEE